MDGLIFVSGRFCRSHAVPDVVCHALMDSNLPAWKLPQLHMLQALPIILAYAGRQRTERACSFCSPAKSSLTPSAWPACSPQAWRSARNSFNRLGACRFSTNAWSKPLSLLYCTLAVVYIGGLGIYVVSGHSLYAAFWEVSRALHAVKDATAMCLALGPAACLCKPLCEVLSGVLAVPLQG